MTFFGKLWVVLGAVALILLVHTGDYEDELQEALYYCKMVKEYKASGGEIGWPDYKGNYSTTCVK